MRPAIRGAGTAIEPGTIFALTHMAPSITGDMSDEMITEKLLFGRELIVKAFAALSSSAAHDRWGMR
jgi:hypothetical protein